MESGGKSLLARYLGMYRVTVNERDTYIVVMNSIRPTRISTTRLYDLKGSKVDRTASEKERSKELPCLKVCRRLIFMLEDKGKPKQMKLKAIMFQILENENLLHYLFFLICIYMQR